MDSLTNPLNYSQQLCQSNQYFIKLLYFSDICFLCKKAIMWKVRKLCGTIWGQMESSIIYNGNAFGS